MPAHIVLVAPAQVAFGQPLGRERGPELFVAVEPGTHPRDVFVHAGVHFLAPDRDGVVARQFLQEQVVDELVEYFGPQSVFSHGRVLRRHPVEIDRLLQFAFENQGVSHHRDDAVRRSGDGRKRQQDPERDTQQGCAGRSIRNTHPA